MLRSERGYVFYKKSDLQNIAKFREKHEPNFDKVKLASLLKKTLAHVLSFEFFEITKDSFVYKTLPGNCTKIVVVIKIESFFHYNWGDSHFYFKDLNHQLLQISVVNCYGLIFS